VVMAACVLSVLGIEAVRSVVVFGDDLGSLITAQQQGPWFIVLTSLTAISPEPLSELDSGCRLSKTALLSFSLSLLVDRTFRTVE
jgi:hypothetical protein